MPFFNDIFVNIYYIGGVEVLYYENFDLDNLITPIKIDRFCQLMKQAEYDPNEIEFLRKGFTDGFSIGYKGDMDAKLISNNLPLRVGTETDLWNKVMKEVKLKRFAGPFKEIPFKEHYIQSPIGLVPKDNGRDTRLIFHLSHPKRSGKSVNENIPEHLCRVSYPEFDEAIRLCLKEGVGCKISRSDAQSAFRNLCIRPQDFWLLIMKAKCPINGQVYWFVDKCLPFGSSISCSHFQHVSNGVAHIVQYQMSKPNINYLDDFFFAALRKHLCNLQTKTFIKICKEIGLPVNLDKTFWGTTLLVFLGLLINTVTQTVSLPTEKIQKGKFLIGSILQRKNKKVTVLEMQKICGFLNFLGKAIVPGRAFTRRLYTVTGNDKLKPHHHIRLNRENRADLETWLTFLQNPNTFCRPFMDFTKIYMADEINFYTDSSGVIGYGGVCNDRWMYGKWEKNFLKKFKPSIAYLELFALTAGVLKWISLFKNRRVILFTDNKSVRDMVNTTSSNCANCMVLIRMIVLKSLLENVRIFAKYVESSKNKYADLLSRDRIPEFKSLCLRTKREISNTNDNVPDELWPMDKLILKN